MKKILLVVLLIVVLVIIVVVMRQPVEEFFTEEEIEELGVKEPEKVNEEEITEDEKIVFDKFGFSLSIPSGWEVEIKDNTKDNTNIIGSFSFYFIPPEGLSSGWFWGVLNLVINEFQPNIEKWIEQYFSPELKDEYNLVGKRRKDIGGKPVFLVEPEEPAGILWLPRYVILGTEYSYTYGFSQDGADGFVQRIIEEIFPYISIK